MVLWLIAIGAILGSLYFGVYEQEWTLSALRIGQRSWDDDFYGAPPLLVHKPGHHHGQTPQHPLFDRVRAATERIDAERYERANQALQVVHDTPEGVPATSLVILVPLMVGVVFKCCCRGKQERPASRSSFGSEASCNSRLTLHDVLGHGPPRKSRPDGRMWRSYEVHRRRSSRELLAVEFPALLNYAEAGSAIDEPADGESVHSRSRRKESLTPAGECLPYASHGVFPTEELTAAGRIQQWLPGVTIQESHGHRPGEYLTARLSDADVHSHRAGQERPLRSRGKLSCRAAVGEKVRAEDTEGPEIKSDFTEHLQYGVEWASEDGSEDIAVLKDYDDEDKPLLELTDGSSDSERSDEHGRDSGRRDGDCSDVNNSGLSEETAYMELPKSARSSEEASICSLDVATQDSWLSVTAAVDPLVVTRSPLPHPSQKPRSVLGQLLEACRQKEPVSFTNILRELDVQNCVKMHESEHADVFLVSTAGGDTMALKVYDCAHFADSLRCVINEIRIGWSLSMLAEGRENQTEGFPQLHMARFVWDSYPALLESACTSYLKRRGSADFRDYGRKLYSPYAVLCMENAGEPLSKAALGLLDNALQVRSVVQQVALALAVAETELEFEHRALTLGHVLLKAARRRVAHYRLMNNALSIELHGWETRIVDFTASRINPGGEEMPIYIGLNQLPDGKRKAATAKLTAIDKLVRPNASRFHPYTNVIFLHDLVQGLLETHKQIFAYGTDLWTDAKRDAWKDIDQWSKEMPSYRSARDFVIARVLPKATLAALPVHG